MLSTAASSGSIWSVYAIGVVWKIQTLRWMQMPMRETPTEVYSPKCQEKNLPAGLMFSRDRTTVRRLLTNFRALRPWKRGGSNGMEKFLIPCSVLNADMADRMQI